ncbi:hypothetical protein BC567DRAFT_294042 [Phyllosticta citribraziliensis]
MPSPCDFGCKHCRGTGEALNYDFGSDEESNKADSSDDEFSDLQDELDDDDDDQDDDQDGARVKSNDLKCLDQEDTIQEQQEQIETLELDIEKEAQRQQQAIDEMHSRVQRKRRSLRHQRRQIRQLEQGRERHEAIIARLEGRYSRRVKRFEARERKRDRLKKRVAWRGRRIAEHESSIRLLKDEALAHVERDELRDAQLGMLAEIVELQRAKIEVLEGQAGDRGRGRERETQAGGEGQQQGGIDILGHVDDASLTEAEQGELKKIDNTKRSRMPSSMGRLQRALPEARREKSSLVWLECDDIRRHKFPNAMSRRRGEQTETMMATDMGKGASSTTTTTTGSSLQKSSPGVLSSRAPKTNIQKSPTKSRLRQVPYIGDPRASRPRARAPGDTGPTLREALLWSTRREATLRNS